MKNDSRDDARRPGNAAPEKFPALGGGKTKSNAIEVPAINLPKGGGAVKGIDEKFTVNAVNGTAGFSIPLPFSRARGAAPPLNLSYNSGSGNGIFGLGWKLSLPSIKRKTDNELPQYLDSEETDTFLFSEAEDLVPEYKREPDGSLSVDPQGNYVIREMDSPDAFFTIRFYKPRIEGLFARIERWTHKTSGETRWRVITKENLTTLFGWSPASRIADPQAAGRVFEWLPELVFDDRGNCTRYVYKKEDEKGFDAAAPHNRNRTNGGALTYTNTYLAKVLYGNKTPYKHFGDAAPPEANFMFRTVFDYGEYAVGAPFDEISDWDFRSDPFSAYRSGFEIRTTRLCRRVLLFHAIDELPGGDALVRSMDLDYDTASAEGFTFLKSITSRGYVKRAGGAYTSKALPAVEFQYQKADWNKEVRTVSAGNLVHSPVASADPNYQFIDLYGEGLSGLLAEQGTGWYYKHNLGNAKFEQAKLVLPKPSFSGLNGRLEIADLDGDGIKQVVSYTAEPRGFFELDDDNDWQPFRAFDASANIDMRDTNTRLLDLTGDGMADVLITEDSVFTWYRSAGRKGFLAPRRTQKPFDEDQGPHVVFAESTQTVFLADMKGDGMTDIVRIRNGEICYWPNLGFGRFGRKVTMDNAPVFDAPDSFNSAFIKLADIDGSGTTDVIYLGKNKFSCWMNLAGNSFGKVAFEIDAFPDISNRSSITVTDLLGNGVPCIVHASDLQKDASVPLRFIDLMNGKKPHLLTGYKNDLGKEVTLEYAPSTRFYIEDKLAGRPWATKLHFPAHCLVKTETRDRVSGSRFASSYRYRHGYFDHAEKEFRGFGMVEQTDSEDFDHWVKGAATNIVDQTLHQAPVVKRSWFQTGAFIGLDRIMDQFADDYWDREMERRGYPVASTEVTLPPARLIAAPGLDPGLIGNLSAQERSEASRACKSMELRVETFAKDAPSMGATPDEVRRELLPFSVAAHNCVIELLQPKGRNKHAVFGVKESEAVTYSYERDPADPRVAHNLTLKLDQYGNILESAAIVYPRAVPDLSLPQKTRDAQGRMFISFVENRYTLNDIDTFEAYRLRVPSEIKTYELRGVPKAGSLYSIGDLENILAASTEVGYHQVDAAPPAGSSQKRLVEHLRTLYYKDDLASALPLRTLSAKGLSFENYQLAYSPALITDIFEARVDAATMTEGKFTHSEGDDNWWVRSGTIQYIEGAETAADAADRFFMPISYTDPYGARTAVKYFSNYFLLVEETEDPLQNKARVLEFNMRTLSPRRMQDANDNISEVLTDELGLVKAMAAFGKGAEADDLAGLDEFTTAAERARIDDFFSAATSGELVSIGKDLLGHATLRFLYDLDVYKDSGGSKPSVAVSIAREEHHLQNPDTAVQLSFEYSNGLGQVIMKKAQAEPGLAKKVTVNPDDSYVINDVDTSLSVPPQLRWVGNGRTVLNNKGNPVKQYEPYFSVTHEFEDLKELVESGVTPIFYYDAAGRAVRTEMPDATFSKTIIDSWKQLNYDQNDTVLETSWYNERFNRLIDAELIAMGKDPGREKQAAEKAAKHASTPTTLHFDSLARPVLQVEHNKDLANADVFYQTTADVDIEGSLRSLSDARGNLLIVSKYDMLGNMAYQKNPDAGARWTLQNIVGNPLRVWDERDHKLYFEYDILHRPTGKKVEGGDGPTPLDHMFEKIVYGEALPGAAAGNFRTRAVITYDTAGKIEITGFDFKGNQLQVSRRFSKNYKEVANWGVPGPDLLLETEAFGSVFQYDAMNRIKRETAPDTSVFEPFYNRAGLLDQVQVTQGGAPESFVKNIDYNEKGQRSRILYGNDVTTSYFYDKETFRLIRLETKRINGDPLQDLYYTFDPVGNITGVEDKNIPEVFFNNQKITGTASYVYDAVYRLIEATGREHIGVVGFGANDIWDDLPFMKEYSSGDPMAWRNYTQRYGYDPSGNIEQMQHIAAGGDWTRVYTNAATSNRLLSTTVGVQTYNYAYPAKHGYIASMPHLQVTRWNFKEELQAAARQSVVNGTPETTWYVYDGGGKRVRKITERQAAAGVDPSKKAQRLYLGSVEIYREYDGAGNTAFERESCHVMDDRRRIAIIETRTIGVDPAPKRLVRYQFGNHLGSASIETDQAAKVISYEEYHPFGTTSYQAMDKDTKAAAKRYRYTGMERDEESGFGYHGGRYFIPWLGRWLTTDPGGIQGGLNLYAYSNNNPVRFVDVNGQDPNDEMMGMMWDRMGQEMSGMIESIFGGHAHVNPRANTVTYEGPKEGVGGLVGGVVRAGTLRIVPIEADPSLPSLIGLEMGAGFVPVLDPGARLVTGETVTGQDTSRAWAGAELALDVLPWALEFKAARMEAKAASLEIRVARDAEVPFHIGSSEAGVRKPTVTNPLCRGDLCVADVGAHQANLSLTPGQEPITNIEFVEASGRPVSRVEDPITNTGDAMSFLNKGFEGLQKKGRITGPIKATIPMEPGVKPGKYGALVKGPMGEHALHVTVSEKPIGKTFIAEGKLVTPTKAAELVDEGVRVVERPVYASEFYDPQNGMCVQPSSEVRSYIKFE